MVGKPDVDRRTVLKSLGGAVGVGLVGGTGMMALSGGAAAATVAFSASNPSKIVNDRGDVTTVTADPGFTVDWSNLDDAVGKVFWLLEAKVGDGEFQPIYRATPWLSADDIGTTGTITRHSSGSGGLGPLVVADDGGLPNYENIDWGAEGRTSYETYMDGTSMGSASAYEGLGFQNNYPDEDAGYYGAASSTEPFDNDDDNAGEGSNKTTKVTLRYTLELQRPNLSQMKWGRATTMYGGERVLKDDKSTTWDSLSDTRKKEVSARIIDGLEVSDIDTGNSKIVMNNEDGYNKFDNPEGITYGGLQAHPDHIGVMTDKTEFYVTVENEGSDGGADGDSNTGAE